jgi:C-3',4' desaturase CrtD
VDPAWDLAVVGGGLGGLAAAALARAQGMRVVLCESHTKLGGCAGYFGRAGYHFDVGATALMGLGPEEPVGRLLRMLGVPFAAERTTSYRVHLPDRRLDIVRDATEFVAACTRIFPECARGVERFWRLQGWAGGTLLRVAGRVPRLPVRSVADLWYDARILGPGGMAAAGLSVVTVDQVLRLLGLRQERAFRALIAMLLQDTAQAGPETVPFANAAACIEAYRAGMSRPRGGMRALAEGIGTSFLVAGGVLKRGTIVDRVEGSHAEGFRVWTRRRECIRAREVVFNLPLDLTAKLLGRELAGRRAAEEAKSRARWSACTAYLAIRREAVPDDAPLFHQVLLDYDRPIHGGNNVLVSLSPLGDPGYGPSDVRVATMSTHTDPSEWSELDETAHAVLKAAMRERLLRALGQALPDAPGSLMHAEFATPRSFARYTRRAGGAVGGAPVSRSNANFLAVGSDVFGPGIWLVGDSVFPGQGTLAVVLSAIRVIERITGTRWAAMRAIAARQGGAVADGDDALVAVSSSC